MFANRLCRSIWPVSSPVASLASADFARFVFHAPPRRGRLIRVLRWLGTLAVLSGCASIRVTDPSRTATEQFLESQALEKSIAQISTAPLRDRNVYVDDTYLSGKSPAPEDLFALGELRAKLLTDGARLVEKRDDADIVMEVRTEGIGIDRQEFLVGIPSIFLTPGGNASEGIPLQTPEFDIIKSTKQHGYAAIAYVAYWRTTGDIVAASGPFTGRTVREDYWFLGLGPHTIGNIQPIDRPGQQ